MPWAKGQSGNPAGRKKKGQTFADLLRAELAKVHDPESGVTNQERVVQMAVEQAKTGSLDAIKWLVERLDGKVKDQVEANVEQRVVVVYEEEDIDAGRAAR